MEGINLATDDALGADTDAAIGLFRMRNAFATVHVAGMPFGNAKQKTKPLHRHNLFSVPGRKRLKYPFAVVCAMAGRADGSKFECPIYSSTGGQCWLRRAGAAVATPTTSDRGGHPDLCHLIYGMTTLICAT